MGKSLLDRIGIKLREPDKAIKAIKAYADKKKESEKRLESLLSEFSRIIKSGPEYDPSTDYNLFDN
ncbi:MAG: hypothetical protein ACP5RE_02825, partial [Candidatus Acidifodinimicrobium sp.]